MSGTGVTMGNNTTFVFEKNKILPTPNVLYVYDVRPYTSDNIYSLNTYNKINSNNNIKQPGIQKNYNSNFFKIQSTTEQKSISFDNKIDIPKNSRL